MNSYYEKGVQLFNLNRYKEASKYLKDSLTETPNDFYAQYYLALCFHHLDEFDNLKQIAIALVGQYPDSDEAHYLLSIYYLSIDNIDKAYEYINSAISLDSYEATYFGYKSLILIQKKEYTKALNTANQGLSIDAKNTLCLNTRTKALTKLQRKEDAFETLQNTLQNNPEDYFTRANAGWTNLELGNYKIAKVHFQEALQKDPNNEYAKEGMLEAIKAKNIVYRSFLKYSFWMEKKSSKYQWGIFISLYLLYRFSTKLSSEFGFSFMIPIIALLYFSFVLGSWIITPVSNAILLSDTYSKYLLNNKDKNAAYSFILLFSIAILSIFVYYYFNTPHLLFFVIATFSSIIPITHSIQKSSISIKNIGFLYGLIIFAIGIFNLIFSLNISILVPIIMFVAYTWLQSLIKPQND
ncbi:tetratricopeptide repeat protein [Tenacibaculum sp. 190524A02b]|uniref:tetratricopeptide repeat protein n=1 Tax=Tenacibaculum vairaonense TaxID=3137860 RepID=UPI0031FA9CB6